MLVSKNNMMLKREFNLILLLHIDCYFYKVNKINIYRRMSSLCKKLLLYINFLYCRKFIFKSYKRKIKAQKKMKL